MALAALRNQVNRLRKRLDIRRPKVVPILDRMRREPTIVMETQGQKPDPWQKSLLTTILNRSSPVKRTLLNCSRQSGKSTVSAALALLTALLERNALVLMLAPSVRQSSELYRKAADAWKALGKPVPAIAESALRVEFANGSRICALPGKDDAAIRGFSAPRLVIIDEAARVSDSLYLSCRPMLAVSRGRMIALSTPWGKRGWWFERWHSSENWHRVRITAEQCPRITAEFLQEERDSLGERWYRQEYMCSFEDTVDAVFSHDIIQAALTDEVQPLFLGA